MSTTYHGRKEAVFYNKFSIALADFGWRSENNQWIFFDLSQSKWMTLDSQLEHNDCSENVSLASPWNELRNIFAGEMRMNRWLRAMIEWILCLRRTFASRSKYFYSRRETESSKITWLSSMTSTFSSFLTTDSIDCHIQHEFHDSSNVICNTNVVIYICSYNMSVASQMTHVKNDCRDKNYWSIKNNQCDSYDPMHITYCLSYFGTHFGCSVSEVASARRTIEQFNQNTVIPFIPNFSVFNR